MINKRNLIILVSVLLLIAIAVIASLFLYRSYLSKNSQNILFGSNQQGQNLNILQNITISGTWTCLPSDFTNELHPDQCVRGLKDEKGNLYVLLYPTEIPEKEGTVSFSGRPQKTVKTTDGTLVNFFNVSKIL